MINICNYELSVVIYYLKDKYPGQDINYIGLNPRSNIKSEFIQHLVSQGDPLTKTINLINFDNRKKNLKLNSGNPFNHTYICVKKVDQKLRKLIANYDWLTEITIHKSKFHVGLNQLKPITSQSAHKYLWQKWQDQPTKANIEAYGLAFQVNKTKQKINIDEVFYLYENLGESENFFNYLANNLGTTKGTEIIIDYSESDLWRLFIGSENKPPLLFYSLKNSNKKDIVFFTFDIIKEAIHTKKYKLKNLLIVWHTWLISSLEENNLDLNDSSILSITNSQLNNLEKLL